MRHQRNNLFNSPNSGSILVLVLVFIVILSFITVAFLEDATARIRYYGLFHNSDDLRVDAYSALEITLAVINEYREIEGTLWGPEQGWSAPLSRINFEPNNANQVDVRFYDEGGKLPLKELDYPTLITLFRVLDFDLSKAEELADSLLDWTDDDNLRRLNGADGEDYERKSPPYKASNKAIETWDEFALIEYYPEAFWDEENRPLPVWNQFKNAVSLHHSGTVNINKANATVLEVAAEMGIIDIYALNQYQYGPDGEPNTADDLILREIGDYALESESSLKFSSSVESLVVEVVASRGEAQFILQTLVTWSGANPAAARTSNGEQKDTDNNPPEENIPEVVKKEETSPRGSAKTKSNTSANLGYPFQIVRILENNRI